MDSIAEVFDTLIRGLLVWGYLFSSKYRKKVHERWGKQGGLQTALEIFVALIGFAFTIFLVWLVFYIAK